MNEKPILFSTPMVQALLREVDPKTQTRRVIVPQPGGSVVCCGKGGYGIRRDYGVSVLQPRYHCGDVLWVREACAKGYESQWNDGTINDMTETYLFEADYDEPTPAKWEPSIHMPRAAARIFLRVTDVRAERVQEISEKDARAEGCVNTHGFIRSSDSEYASPPITATEAFAQLWDSLNAKRGFGWVTNPWVWAYTFEQAEKPEGWPG